MLLTANTKEPPLASSIVIKLLKPSQDIICEWVKDSKETKFVFDNISFDSDASVCRYLARLFPDLKLYGTSSLRYLEVDHWLSFAIGPLQNYQQFQNSISYLDRELSTVTYLVENDLTIADIVVWSVLHQGREWNKVRNNKECSNVLRWYSFIASQNCVIECLKSIPGTENMSQANMKTANGVSSPEELKTEGKSSHISRESGYSQPNGIASKEEGKFVDLPGAEMGKVVVRFPPEASGYLHIGHAKAALLNQYYQEKFQGKLIMRFDDTNPAKEKVDFEKVILEDLKLLQISPDVFTHTSDYFDLMLQYCEKLIKDAKAYVDDTEPEVMKAEREQKTESKHRKNSVAKNLKMWQEMLAGTDYGVKCCVRAKIDMASANGCMRDPTIYRCKPEVHPKTGNKYKVYPTYDFACPIVDSIEGVTHCLRTTEYHDRDDQFYWFIDALSLRKPYIWEYSRLNMTNTVLSKRKLTWFVEEGYVDGWDDPRFPTVRGIIRRGMTVAGLKQFIIAQGSSRSVVSMEWDKIWAFNKKVIDPVAPRYNALESTGTVPVLVEGVETERLQVPKHPKNEEVGKKWIWKSNRVLIDQIDAEALKENENATFINWGNVLVTKINRNGTKITSIEAKENLSNTDYKKTLKLTWLSDLKEAPFVPTICVYFDHIITKPILAKDEDFKQHINSNTKLEVKMLGDPELINVKKGDIIQLQRRGFYICDQEYKPPSIYTCNGTPIILFFVPDGHSKETGITAQSKRDTVTENVAKAKDKSKNEQADNEKKTAKAADNSAVAHSNAISDPAVIEEATKLLESIKNQGDRIRQLKSEKREKSVIDDEVNTLLQLKKTFKTLTNVDWKPGVTIEKLTSAVSSTNQGASSSSQDKATLIRDLYVKVCLQTSKVRHMQAQKVNKNLINTEITLLADLKERYKTEAGQQWSLEEGVSIEDYYTKELHNKVTQQGTKVRQLKADKAAKNIIDSEVQKLLDLKAEYKAATGSDYNPSDSKFVENQKQSSGVVPGKGQELHDRITEQGNKVRQLKSEKAGKETVDAEVKKLLELKAQYKTVTGSEYKPPTGKPAEIQKTNATVSGGEQALFDKVSEQGNKVRQLKAEKATKEVIDSEVKKLVDLKAQYKTITGSEYTPSSNQPIVKKEASTSDAMSDKGQEVNQKIIDQGNKVRQLKADKSAKEVIDGAVKVLLELKEEYKKVTGTAWTPNANSQVAVAPAAPKPTKSQKAKAEKPKQAEKAPADASVGLKKQTRLGLEARKDENLSDWYTQVITKSELIEYYDVSGCYTLRPWAFAIWKIIRSWFDHQITDLGVDECYFPIFVSKNALEREKTHIADFAPEVAWVTKSGDSDLEEPIAIRPTSETVMYPAYAKWIRSHRDLPLKLNQWNNVVRWEFKHPQPFLRTREFLWQEGHTAYATQKEAVEEVYCILDLYAKVYTDLLAIPVIRGRKTEKEKFAGGDFTTTVEAFISASGRGIQGATSHHLGQNFSKMFEIVVEDPETQEKKFIYQNSWGMTTRTIGVMIMVHGDDQGLVLPPKVAKIQVVIVPCGISATMKPEDRATLDQSCLELEKSLKAADIRTHFDSRDNYSSGWKFNHWELKGVPVRIELGPKDIKQNQVVAVRRDSGAKSNFKRDSVVADVTKLLDDVQQALYNKAEQDLKTHTVICEEWSSFVTKLNEKNIILSPFCNDILCEDKIKQDSARNEGSDPGAPSMGAKSLCIPFDQPKEITSSVKCIHPECKNNAKFYTLFGRSY